MRECSWDRAAVVGHGQTKTSLQQNHSQPKTKLAGFSLPVLAHCRIESLMSDKPEWVSGSREQSAKSIFVPTQAQTSAPSGGHSGIGPTPVPRRVVLRCNPLCHLVNSNNLDHSPENIRRATGAGYKTTGMSDGAGCASPKSPSKDESVRGASGSAGSFNSYPSTSSMPNRRRRRDNPSPVDSPEVQKPLF
jgi:hypothetical protein